MAPAPTIAIGSAVELCGLKSKPEMNGERGTVVDFMPAARGRCVVDVTCESKRSIRLSLKPENLLLLPSMAGED